MEKLWPRTQNIFRIAQNRRQENQQEQFTANTKKSTESTLREPVRDVAHGRAEAPAAATLWMPENP